MLRKHFLFSQHLRRCFLNIWEESWWTFKLGFLAVRKTSELLRWGTEASPYIHLWGRSVALSGVKRWFPSRIEHQIRAMVKLKVQEEITCITYLEFWYSWLKILKYEPYCHFTIIPMISTFYYTSISLRDKKKKRKKERKKGDEKMKQKRSSAQKRETGEKEIGDSYLNCGPYFIVRAESVWCTCKVSGESAGEEQKGGGIAIMYMSCFSSISQNLVGDTVFFHDNYVWGLHNSPNFI